MAFVRDTGFPVHASSPNGNVTMSSRARKVKRMNVTRRRIVCTVTAYFPYRVGSAIWHIAAQWSQHGCRCRRIACKSRNAVIAASHSSSIPVIPVSSVWLTSVRYCEALGYFLTLAPPGIDAAAVAPSTAPTAGAVPPFLRGLHRPRRRAWLVVECAVGGDYAESHSGLPPPTVFDASAAQRGPLALGRRPRRRGWLVVEWKRRWQRRWGTCLSFMRRGRRRPFSA
jgi:hypothetical protein